jgi:DNA-binding MarR family transcriptional regulator
MTSNQILVALRRITRAIDLRSKKLEKLVGLTVPQLLVLQVLRDTGEQSVSELARGVSLSQSTVTSILMRLQTKGLVAKEKRDEDRRKVLITLTDLGRERLEDSPELLQKEFINRFQNLESWEQKMLVSAVERIASIMDADTVDASPILQLGEIILDDGDLPSTDESGD